MVTSADSSDPWLNIAILSLPRFEPARPAETTARVQVSLKFELAEA